MRSASARSASERPWPICISRSTRANSSASGPSVLRATCCTRGVEAEAGLDADRQQVDRVRQLALHLARCGRRPSGRGRGSGAKKPTTRAADDHEQPHRDRGARAAAVNTQRDDQAGDRADDLAGDDPVDGPAGRVAGEVELVPDPLGGVGAGEPLADLEGARLAAASRTRSENGRSSSAVSSAGAVGIASSTASERLMPWGSRLGDRHARRRAIATRTSAAPMIEEHGHLTPPPSPVGSSRRRRRRAAGRAPPSMSQPIGSVNSGIT